MEIQQILKRSLIKRYKANAIIITIEKEVEGLARAEAFRKHKNKTLKHEGKEWKLVDVEAYYESVFNGSMEKEVILIFIYSNNKEKIEINKKITLDNAISGHFTLTHLPIYPQQR